MSYFRGKSYFEDNGTQNLLVFQPIHKYFKTASDKPSIILSWKSKGLSDESIDPPTRLNKIINPSLDFVGIKARVEFSGDCLKPKKITYHRGKIVNINIVYKI